jgi:hypothetical protein
MHSGVFLLTHGVLGGQVLVYGQVAPTGSAPWTLPGHGTRVTGGWELSGLSVPASGRIRARGRTAGGLYNGSSGLVENMLDPGVVLKISDYTVSVPPGGGNGRGIRITAEGGIGATTAMMELQAPVSLAEWSTVATARADGTGRAVFDYADSGGERQYYRVRLP